jgi:hypothetical protein
MAAHSKPLGVGIKGNGLNAISMIEDPTSKYLNEICLTAINGKNPERRH